MADAQEYVPVSSPSGVHIVRLFRTERETALKTTVCPITKTREEKSQQRIRF